MTPSCHPERKYRARGLCNSCYDESRPPQAPKTSSAARRHRLKSQYGVTVEQFEALLRFQGGKCANDHCRSTADLCIDHDHVTGDIRGILCRRCNIALGLVHDDTNRLKGLADYLSGSSTGEPLTRRPRPE